MQDKQRPRDEAEIDPLVNYTPSSGPSYRYNTFWPRLGAGMIDGIILLPLQ